MTNLDDLGPDMLAQVAINREWVENWIAHESQIDYTDPGNMIALVRAILDSGEVGRDETAKLRALGTYLGLAISAATGWPAKQLTDEQGTDFVLVFREPDGVVFPSTLLSKRIEAGEEVDVFELVTGLITEVQEVLAQES